MIGTSHISCYNPRGLHSTVHEYNQPLLHDGVSVCCHKQTMVFKEEEGDTLSNVDSRMDTEAKSSA